MGWSIRYYLCRKLTGNHLVVPVESRKYYNQTVLFELKYFMLLVAKELEKWQNRYLF